MMLLTPTLLMAAIPYCTSFHTSPPTNLARIPASVSSIPSFPSLPPFVSNPRRRPASSSASQSSASPSSSLFLSTWDNFSYDDDDELLETPADANFVAADENDDPEVKAAAGMALEAPEVDYDGPVIQVPQGMCRFCSGFLAMSRSRKEFQTAPTRNQRAMENEINHLIS